MQAERQKLMLKDKAGKPVTDATPLSEVKLPGPGGKIMMLGSLEADISKAEAMAAQAPEVQDDFDVDDGAGGTMRDLTQDPIVLQKLQRRINSVEVKVQLLIGSFGSLFLQQKTQTRMRFDVDQLRIRIR